MEAQELRQPSPAVRSLSFYWPGHECATDQSIPLVLPQPLRLTERIKYSPSSTRSHGEKDSMLLYDTANERLGHPGPVLLMILQH